MTALIKDDVVHIIDEYIRERIIQYDFLKEELRQIKSGELVLVPVNREHAENMIKMGQFYIDHSDEN